MKRMLFNATQEEELRVALVDGQRLYDLNIELPASERKKANIYKGKITRIEPSLEAAFVNYGADRHGFLPLKEISSEYFLTEVTGGNKPNIRDVLKEGQDIVVQIDKEERGTKGAALTTFVSLAGRFIVLKPNKPRSGGVSRRIVGEDRDLARTTLREVDVPEGMSVILRTAGIDRSREELEWDLNNLLAIWEAIKTVVVQRTSPFLIYRESDSVVRALRDYLTTEIGEILIDDDKAYEQAREFIEQVMPHNLKKLKLYTDPVPLFTRYQIESQIESAFAHQVTLPSGGSMVIDHTEALVSIDINSARATKGGDIEATALQTNLEAADEVGRQLRLRDLGGLVVIDFIDMGPQKHQREVETRLREAVRQDRARVQIGKISRFGLLEMSRQRLRPSLGESSYLTCPRCSGVGTIRSVESLALAILRLIGEEARKERTAKVIAQLPVEVATYLLNEKRDWVQNVEARHKMQVILVANPNLETPHYVVRRVRDDQLELPENTGVSYELTETEEEQLIPQAVQPKPPAEVPAVSSQVVTTPPPTPAKPAKFVDGEAPGLLARIIGLFSPASADEEPASNDRRKPARGRTRSGRQDRQKEAGQQTGSRRPTRSSKKKTKRSAQLDGDDARSEQHAKGSKKKKKKKKSKKKSSKTVQQGQQAQAAKAETDQPDQSKPQSEPTQGRRRSRGGRRRRRSKEDTDVRQESAGRDDRVSNDESTRADRDKPARGNDDVSRQDSSRAAEQAGKAAAAAADAKSAPTTRAESASEDRSATPQQRADDSDSRKPQSSPATAADRGKEDAGSGEDAAASASVAVRSADLEQRPAASNGGNGGSTADNPPAGPKSESADAPKTRLLPWEPQQSAQPASDKAGDSSDS